MNEPSVPVLSDEASDAARAVPDVRVAREVGARAARIARKITERGILGVYRPAKGHACILSERRQYRKLVTKQFPKLRSGRQWVKFRKALHRQSGLDYFTIPTYKTA